jgi:beta-glucosidase
MVAAAALGLSICAGGGGALAVPPTDPDPTPRELAHAQLARETGTEGMVLLDNSGAALPVAAGPVALYGVGAYKTVKGGTGSGDVNQRYVVTINQGLEAAGYTLTQSPVYSDEMIAKTCPSSGGGMWGSTNYAAALEEILRLKPTTSKGRYLLKATVATTMGPGIAVDPSRTRRITSED